MATTDGHSVRTLGDRAWTRSRAPLSKLRSEPAPALGGITRRAAPAAFTALLALIPSACAVLGPDSPEFADTDLVEVRLVTAQGEVWRITTAPDLSSSEFAETATRSEKRATPGQMQVLLDSLADAGFFEAASDVDPVAGGSLTVDIRPGSGTDRAPERFTVVRPLTDFDRAREYRRYVDVFHNDGFNRITQLRPSDDPQSVLRDFQRGNR